MGILRPKRSVQAGPWNNSSPHQVNSLVAQPVKNLSAIQETHVQSLGVEDPLEKGMATHSSILAWRTHGQRSLEGYSPWGSKESDMTERLTLSLCTRISQEEEEGPEQGRINPVVLSKKHRLEGKVLLGAE